MSASNQSIEEMQEVFIHLHARKPEEAERAIKIIEGMGGRVLHTFLPSVIIGSLPPRRIHKLRGEPGVEAVYTDEISDEQLENVSEEIRLAAMTWNKHIQSKRLASPQTNPEPGLSWDAPGRLPPDPPPDIQEMLRRRERGMKSGE